MNAPDALLVAAVTTVLAASCADADPSLLRRRSRADAAVVSSETGADDAQNPDAAPMDAGAEAAGDADASTGDTCPGGDAPRSEMCNDEDDDCDGEVDEDFGDIGDDCTVSSGRCAGEGTLVCRPDGSGAVCAGESDPSAATDELCNGVDDDCDGDTDEELDGPSCALTDGVCAEATQSCGGIDGYRECQELDYGSDYQADEDLCDRLDNDCDGRVDEACCESVCDLTPQCGCVQGEACYPTGSGTETACAVSGDKEEGDACSGVADCAPGLVCLTTSGGSFCHQACATSADCDGGPGSLCTLTDSDVPGKICSLDCNPVTNARCPIDTLCSIFSDDEGDYTECISAGNGTDGTPCTFSGDCAPGFSCINTGGDFTCLQRCVVANPACPAARSCMSFTPSVTIGGIEFGICY